MESPTRISNIEQPHTHHLSCSSGRKSNDFICASPEFEFWMVRNPSFPQTNLHSADELFEDGILRPLYHLHIEHNPPSNHKPHSETGPHPNPQPLISPASLTAEPSNSTTLTSSKRWKDMFKKPSTTTRNHQVEKDRDKERAKEKKKEKKGVSTALNAAESLSIINIWPFSRSRSAGNNGSRGRMLSGTRKVSSAPCSRSNSGGESKTRKCPSSPSRSGGVHLGRSSPVWQLRRTSDHNKSDPSRRSRPSSIPTTSADGNKCDPSRHSRPSFIPTTSADGNKARVLNFNVPNTCIGYAQHLSCRSDENSNGGGVRTGGHGARPDTGTATNVVSANNLFNLRSLFSTKKVH